MKFDSPTDLGIHLYDRAVQPRMGPMERLLLAVRAADAAEELWAEHTEATA